MTKKLLKYLRDPDYRFLVNAGLGLYRSMPDEAYLKRVFQARMGKPLNLDVPESLSEKLQWLKLHDRNPAYHQMVDKLEAKAYVSAILGAQYVIPTLASYRSAADIDFDALPERFVLKCTHDSGGIVICADKAKLDRKAALQKLSRGLKRDYYAQWREWPYKDLPRRILAEPYLESDANGLTDYKIHCFRGEPRLVLVCRDRFADSGLTEDFFTEDWEHLPVRRPSHPNASVPIPRPAQLDEMLRLSRVLAREIPFVRIDFYLVKEQVLFSEITFFPASGLTPFVPERWDQVFGGWLELDP